MVFMNELPLGDALLFTVCNTVVVFAQILLRYGLWRVQANFKCVNHMVMKFHMLGKMPHHCHDVSKEFLGTHALAYGTAVGWMPLTSGGKMLQMPPTVVCQQLQWCITCGTSTCSILCMSATAEVGVLTAFGFIILSEHLVMWKIYAKWIPQVLNNGQCTVYVFLSTTQFQQQ
jgi:hypothetical protein